VPDQGVQGAGRAAASSWLPIRTAVTTLNPSAAAGGQGQRNGYCSNICIRTTDGRMHAWAVCCHQYDRGG
jgi:hypothetical protein